MKDSKKLKTRKIVTVINPSITKLLNDKQKYVTMIQTCKGHHWEISIYHKCYICE